MRKNEALTENVIRFLDAILSYDWFAFNQLDIQAQNQEWRKLLNGITEIVQALNVTTENEFQQIYELIASYGPKFRKLPIEGKVHALVNNFFISRMLKDLVVDIHFETTKIENNCNCNLKYRLGKTPELNDFKEIGVIHDGYYRPKLHNCPKCGFKWISFLSDDSDGKTCIEKFSNEDIDRVEYY
jgi:hypothetical protein